MRAKTAVLRENAIIFSLAAILFFHMVEFIIIMPLGPQLMREMVINPHEFSFLISAYNFTAAASAVFGLLWMDRLDRKASLLTVNTLFCLGTAACFFAFNYQSFLIARSVTGAFGGIMGALCMTIVGDLVPIERRGFAMGKLMASFSLASIFGIPLGLKIAQLWHWQTPFLFIAGGSFVAGLLALRFVPPLRGHIEQAVPLALMVAEIKALVIKPEHLRSFAFMALLMFGQFTIIPFISPALVRNMGLPETKLTFVYLVGGLCTAVTTPLIGRLADRFGKRLLFQICAALATIPILLLTHIGPLPVSLAILISSIFFIFISGRMSPAMALMTELVDPKKRGRFMSVNSAFQQAFAGLAAILAGKIISQNPVGKLQDYHYVGYISVTAVCFSIYWVHKLKPFSTKSDASKPSIKAD